jgi:hypothetical protein
MIAARAVVHARYHSGNHMTFLGNDDYYLFVNHRGPDWVVDINVVKAAHRIAAIDL